MPPEERSQEKRIAGLVFFVMWMAVLIGSLLLALRNVRLARADRRGAFRLAVFVFAVKMLAWIFRASHCPDLEPEVTMFYFGLVMALQSAFRYWLCYIALEPYVRKLWPESLISWNRLLSGRLSDPKVGRHVLIGTLFGVGLRVLVGLGFLIPTWPGSPPAPHSRELILDTLVGSRYLAAGFLDLLVDSIYYGLLFLLFFLLLRILLRTQLLAAGALLAVGTMFGYLGDPSVHWACWPLLIGTFIILLTRFGLFAAVVAFFTSLVLSQAPIAADVAAWYIAASVLAWLLVFTLALYGFYISLAGRPLFREESLLA